ncbi:MAG: cytochrome c biogenesis protein CcdA [Candidatus Blackburnbacteria bacterium]|nr:cytochrome c biogenesis protein CcdA [Candidatus Blackburnbacteria bacterium]
MDVLLITSLVASFFAGVAALFAPCCITVLLPSYIGSIFSQRKMVLGMTGVFSLGLLSVFLPIGLGAAYLGKLFTVYHDQIYILGALFLLGLGIWLLLGKSFSLPWHATLAPSDKLTIASIFGLGVFSGFATSCCAPVLAGLVALSVLPGSLLWGGLYAAFYVLGMAAPLFALAWVLDRTRFTQKFFLMRKTLSYTLAGQKVEVTAASLLAGVIFLLMGALIFYLALTGNLRLEGDYKITINAWVAWMVEKLGGAR